MGSIQKTILTKDINFKSQSIFSIISLVTSGIVGISMAYNGFGVWSLVVSALGSNLVLTSLLWYYSKWIPSIKFSINSFRELFSFGKNILISYIIDAVFRNSYSVMLGKYYSPTDLGLFNKAQVFSDLPSKTLSSVIKEVSFPVLSKLQDSNDNLKKGYQTMLKLTMFITIPSILLLIVIAESFIVILIGEKWVQSVIYLQLLCVVGLFYPLHSMNVNVLMVKGRSDLFLRIEIIKKTLVIPALIIGYYYGLVLMIIAMIINSIISFFINSYYTKEMIDYSGYKQLLDIKNVFLISLISAVTAFLVTFYSINEESLLLILITKVIVFISINVGILLYTQNTDARLFFSIAKGYIMKR
jgi:teichuronic acid exporter